MGNSLDEFEVRMTFNSNGKVDRVEYADGAGCGHSKEVDPYATTVNELVEYHLRHYKTSHRMEPSRMCNFMLPHPSDPGIEYRCNLEPHIGDDHELVLKRKRK